MDLSRLNLFSKFVQRMNWLGERQKVLAQNVANADTPGYVARDIRPFEFRVSGATGRGRIGLAQSNSAHAGGSESGMAQGGLTAKQKETTLSGNSVTLDHELMKSADTAMDYQLVTNLYRKQIGMFRAVLTRGG
jgi:flagellar basal-body rod protein FlgB